jgi:ribosome-associated protein
LTENNEAPDILGTVVEAIHQRHGYGVRAMDMSEFPLTMDVFVLATADTRIQTRAVADHLEREMRKLGIKMHHCEGYDEGSWILQDFVDFVVHVFLPETRAYYSLETLWSDAPYEDYRDGETGAGDEFPVLNQE